MKPQTSSEVRALKPFLIPYATLLSKNRIPEVHNFFPSVCPICLCVIVFPPFTCIHQHIFFFHPMNNIPLSVLSLAAMYRGGLESSLCFSGVVWHRDGWHALIKTIKCIWTTAGFYFESTNMKKTSALYLRLFTPFLCLPPSLFVLVYSFLYLVYLSVCVSSLHACSVSLLYL